ncbi:MAG: universal stress protein [Burkholderiales bacterium]
MYQNILVATDGSKLSKKAINTAISIAAPLGARLVGFYAMSEYPAQVYAEGASFTGVVTPGQFLAEQKEFANRILGELARTAKKAGITADTVTVQKRSPYEAIIATANKKKCDLIVMASHGRRGLSSLLLGSETQKVLTHSKIPVLVVR